MTPIISALPSLPSPLPGRHSPWTGNLSCSQPAAMAGLEEEEVMEGGYNGEDDEDYSPRGLVIDEREQGLCVRLVCQTSDTSCLTAAI